MFAFILYSLSKQKWAKKGHVYFHRRLQPNLSSFDLIGQKKPKSANMLGCFFALWCNFPQVCEGVFIPISHLGKLVTKDKKYPACGHRERRAGFKPKCFGLVFTLLPQGPSGPLQIACTGKGNPRTGSMSGGSSENLQIFRQRRWASKTQWTIWPLKLWACLVGLSWGSGKSSTEAGTSRAVSGTQWRLA